MHDKVQIHIDNFLKQLKNIDSCSDLTLKAYRLDLSQIFKSDSVFNTSEDLWNQCRPCLAKWGHLSLSSRNRKIATLKSFFNYLYNQKIIDRNYADQLICPKVPKKIPHFISVDEVMSVIQFLNSSELNSSTMPALKENHKLEIQQQKVLFYLLYGAGLRISEACGLKWKDINFDLRRLLVHGKGSKERLVIVPHICANILKEHQLNIAKNIFVFGDKSLSPRKGFAYIQKLGASAGLMNPLNPHSLRHSFATHLLASGTNLRTLQSILGHESLQATEKYTHLNIDILARTVEAKHPLSKKRIDENS